MWCSNVTSRFCIMLRYIATFHSITMQVIEQHMVRPAILSPLTYNTTCHLNVLSPLSYHSIFFPSSSLSTPHEVSISLSICAQPTTPQFFEIMQCAVTGIWWIYDVVQLHYNALHWVTVHNIVWCYIVLCYIVLCCVLLLYIVLRYIALRYIALHCILLHCILLHCIVSCYTVTFRCATQIQAWHHNI